MVMLSILPTLVFSKYSTVIILRVAIKTKFTKKILKTIDLRFKM